MKKAAKNVIFILSDQHRFDALGGLNPTVKTPNLDRIARQGMTFQNSYVVTQPCVPSRASILTGKYNEQHGMTESNTTVLSRHEKTWAGQLSENGCQTVAIGRTHGIDNGFRSVVLVPNGNSYPADRELQLVIFENAYIGPSEASFDDYYETRVTKTAVEFLREAAKGGKPFALHVGYLAPHAPLTPPEPYWSMYKDLDVDLPYDTPVPLNPSRFANVPMTKERYRNIVRGYYAMISTIDACIGMIMDECERLGIAEETLILYTSDHGDMLGNKGVYSKSYGYDPSIRVPLMAMCPGTIPAGVKMESLTENIDLAPTITEAMGLPPMQCPGKSLWGLMTGEKEDDFHRPYIYSLLNAGFVYRTSWYKWIHRFVRGENVDEVFDMLADPHENNDLSQTEEGRAFIAESYPTLVNHLVFKTKRIVTDYEPDALQGPPSPYFPQ